MTGGQSRGWKSAVRTRSPSSARPKTCGYSPPALRPLPMRPTSCVASPSCWLRPALESLRSGEVVARARYSLAEEWPYLVGGAAAAVWRWRLELGLVLAPALAWQTIREDR